MKCISGCAQLRTFGGTRSTHWVSAFRECDWCNEDLGSKAINHWIIYYSLIFESVGFDVSSVYFGALCLQVDHVCWVGKQMIVVVVQPVTASRLVEKKARARRSMFNLSYAWRYHQSQLPAHVRQHAISKSIESLGLVSTDQPPWRVSAKSYYEYSSIFVYSSVLEDSTSTQTQNRAAWLLSPGLLLPIPFIPGEKVINIWDILFGTEPEVAEPSLICRAPKDPSPRDLSVA